MGEIHELFVLALSLVWFAGATPEFIGEIIPKLGLCKNSPSYRPKMKKKKMTQKRLKKEVVPLFVKRLKSDLKSDLLNPLKSLSSHFAGQSVTFLSLFESLYKKGRKSLFSLFRVKINYFLVLGL